MTDDEKPQSAFEKYLAERLEEPAVRAGFEYRTMLQRVIDRLIGSRKALEGFPND